MADLDGDGLLDIVVGKRMWAHPPPKDIEPDAPPVLYWFQLHRDGKGGATFIPLISSTTNQASGVQVTVADMNGRWSQYDILTRLETRHLPLPPGITSIREAHLIAWRAMKRRSSGWKRVAAVLATGAWLLAPGFTSGTGYIGPTAYLAEGGRLVAEAPEFYWETELKRLARDFVPPEKLVRPPEAVKKEGEEIAEPAKPEANFTSTVDLQDFDAALREGRIKPPDKAKAAQQHKAARDLIDLTNEDSSDSLGEEWNSEFADYHRGAHAYARGKAQYDPRPPGLGGSPQTAAGGAALPQCLGGFHARQAGAEGG